MVAGDWLTSQLRREIDIDILYINSYQQGATLLSLLSKTRDSTIHIRDNGVESNELIDWFHSRSIEPLAIFISFFNENNRIAETTIL